MSMPTSTQLYFNYDAAIADLVHLVRYRGRPLLHVFAVPERAMAQIERKLKERGEDSAQRVTPLPFVAIDRIDESFEVSRASRAVWRRFAHTAGDRYFKLPWPIPMRLTYQITFWVRELEDSNDFLVQWLSMFDHTPLRYIEVKHPFPMNIKIVPVLVTEIARPSAIVGEEKQRNLRLVVTNVVSGWIMRPAIEHGIVETVTTEFIESEDLVTEGDTLGTVVVTA